MYITLSKIFGIDAIREYLERRDKRRQDEAEARWQKIKEEDARAKIPEQIRNIMHFPIKELTVDEFNAIPKGKDVDLKTCKLGTWFVCTKFEPLPDVIVVGQVVTGYDLIADQWGAGTSIPERGISRYRVEII